MVSSPKAVDFYCKQNDLSIRSAAVDVNDTKRARCCLKVAVCAIYMKLNDAYYQRESDLPILE